MAEMRRFQIFLVVIICLLFAITTTISSTAAAATSYDLNNRRVSPFVRKSLGMGSDSSSRFRRLAGSANCTAMPSMCSSATNFPAGASCCPSGCADLQTDKNNCGFCSFTCAASLGCCSGTCVSMLTDNSNCGACGTTCKTSLCSSGLCGYGG